MRDLCRARADMVEDLTHASPGGEEPPRWAAPLAAAPGEPGARGHWAVAVARVALYWVAHRVEDDNLLGPNVALGSPTSPARAAGSASAPVRTPGRSVGCAGYWPRHRSWRTPLPRRGLPLTRPTTT